MYSTTSSSNYQLDFPTQQPQQQSLEMNDYSYQQQRHDSMDYSRRPSYFTGLLGSTSTSEASYSDHEQQTPSPFTGYEDYNNQQFHHPLDNSIKRRMSTAFELPHLYGNASFAATQQHQLGYPVVPYNNNNYQQQRCNSSPMIYANPAVDMYSPQAYAAQAPHPQQGQYNAAVSGYHPLVVDNLIPSTSSLDPMSGLFRERACSSSSLSSDSSSLSTPPPTAPTTQAASRRTSKATTTKTLNNNKPTRSRGRRVSNSPSIAGQKVFTCKHDDCGKVFKRSEHLKRHVRSIHTLEKRKFLILFYPCSFM